MPSGTTNDAREHWKRLDALNRAPASPHEARSKGYPTFQGAASTPRREATPRSGTGLEFTQDRAPQHPISHKTPVRGRAAGSLGSDGTTGGNPPSDLGVLEGRDRWLASSGEATAGGDARPTGDSPRARGGGSHGGLDHTRTIGPFDSVARAGGAANGLDEGRDTKKESRAATERPAASASSSTRGFYHSATAPDLRSPPEDGARSAAAGHAVQHYDRATLPIELVLAYIQRVYMFARRIGAVEAPA
jgi:hypothetical protein